MMDWASMLVEEMNNILTPNISILMGIICVIIICVVLLFNHYSWRRAFILIGVSIIGAIGWYALKLQVLGSAADVGNSLTETAITFMLIFFVSLGYLLAAVLHSLLPDPLVKTRRGVVKVLTFVILTVCTGLGYVAKFISVLSVTLYRVTNSFNEAGMAFIKTIPVTYERDSAKVVNYEIQPILMEIMNDPNIKKPSSFPDKPLSTDAGLHPS